MAATVALIPSSDAAKQYSIDLSQKLQSTRHVEASLWEQAIQQNQTTPLSISDVLSSYAAALREAARPEEAAVLEVVKAKLNDEPQFGGLGLANAEKLTPKQYEESLFLADSWLESLNSRDRAPQRLAVNSKPSEGTKPMTLAQKIFSQHVVGPRPAGGLSAGDVVRVGVDWILASELSWAAMANTYKEMGAPGIWRNDRFWLAGDHVVHPSNAEVPQVKTFVDRAEEAKRAFKMTEYQGMNYTIMHTEFVRERAEPGMLCIGSDSHTCSAGAMGCLSIGLGTADVMMTLALGETWFKIPESILIVLEGEPAPAISGKDVILHILKELKRNTVAAERIVEFAGDGVKHLSCDARFAIANMCTEFGAVTGIFVPDGVTKGYVDKRRRAANKTSSLYFRPDAEAQYAGRYTIRLDEVEPSVAVYPNPDDVVPVSEKAGLKLDGVFIGACTTTEEELVLAALVLKVGLEKGLPLARGRRHYVPGSLPIVNTLQKLGLLEVYEAAGFTRGPPGCSFCLGLSADKAAEGETWLSSQNRNFKNRMGKGSIGHVTSAVVCAASAFTMTVTSPLELLKEIDVAFLDAYRGREHASAASVEYVEPSLCAHAADQGEGEQQSGAHVPSALEQNVPADLGAILSRVARLGDFIDTDALAPGETLTTCVTDEEFGQHVLKHTYPDFREKARCGQQVVVAGAAFGVGSSRECAVSGLKGVGVKAVIAKSFAFIYQRNQPSLGLLGFTISDDAFYELAEDGEAISIDVPARTVTVSGKEFDFVLSEIEYNLTTNNGISQSFKKYGRNIWTRMTGSDPRDEGTKQRKSELSHPDKRLNW